jgi:hypothetical protein
MKAQPTNRMLIDENPLMVLPSLVRLVGLERAIILQQIHYTLRQPRSGKNIQGFHWIYNTAEEWSRDHFPFWKPDTIRKLLKSLEKDGYVIASQFDKARWDRRKYYRIDYELLNSHLSEAEESPQEPESDAGSIRNPMPDEPEAGAGSEPESDAASLTETSPEIFSETTATTIGQHTGEQSAIAVDGVALIRKELVSSGVQHGDRLEEAVKRLAQRPDGDLIARLIAQGVALRAERELICGRPLANPAGLIIKTILSYPLDEPVQTEASVDAALDVERKALERAKHAQQHRGKSVRRQQVEYTEGDRRASDERARRQLEELEAGRRATVGDRLREYQERLSKAQTDTQRQYWRGMIDSLGVNKAGIQQGDGK